MSSSNHSDRKLIFDIGLHNSDDAAYYLALGNRVVGVEANPLLAASCETRFSAEIEQRRMTVVNAGVLDEPGKFTFYRNLQDDGWSSFQPEKGNKGGPWEEMVIPCVTTEQLIEEHGRPFFMKVDIEGADLQALASLTHDTAPAYVSVELSFRDPIVEKLIELDTPPSSLLMAIRTGPRCLYSSIRSDGGFSVKLDELRRLFEVRSENSR